jgi:WD40 repeat protein
VWDTQTGNRVASFGHNARALALSADGRMLAAVSSAGLEVVNLETRAWRKLADPDQPSRSSQATKISLNPSGDLLAVTQADTVDLWDVARGRPIAVLAVYDGGAFDAEFSPDGRYLALSGIGGVSIVDATGNLAGMRRNAARGLDVLAGVAGLQKVDGEPIDPYSLSFDPAGTRLAVATQLGDVVWGFTTGTDTTLGEKLQGGEDRLVTFAPDGRTIVTSNRGDLNLFAARNAPPSWSLASRDSGVTALAAGAEGDVVATGMDDGSVLLWNPALWNPTFAGARKLLCPFAKRNLTQKEWASLVGAGHRHRTCASWP